MTGLCSVLVLCALSFIPVIKHNKSTAESQQEDSKLKRMVGSLVYLPNWRNKRFVVWTLAIPLALFGYFVPYVHLPMFAKEIPLDEDEKRNGEKASQLIMCIGVSSGLGRLISGFLADLPLIKRDGNRILLQQISFFSIGVCTMLLTLAQMFGQNVFLVRPDLARSHPLNSLSVSGLVDFLFYPRHLRRLLHHNAGTHRLRPVWACRGGPGHRLPPGSLLHPSHSRPACGRLHLRHAGQLQSGLPGGRLPSHSGGPRHVLHQMSQVQRGGGGHHHYATEVQ